jgi:diguanylate cyclase (GGDEF)-like protein/PAS domain S-box-containing protein
MKEREYVTVKDAGNEIKIDIDKLRIFLELPMNLICIFSRNGEVIECNPAWEDILGYRKQDMIGENFYDYIHPDDIERTREIHSITLKGSVGKYINRIRCSDGNYKNFEWRLTTSGEYILASAVDITKQIITENSLKEEEDRYKKLFSNMSDGLWVIDRDGRFIDVNESACRTIGYSMEELMGLTLFDIDPTIDQEKYKNIFNRLLNKEKIVYHGIHIRKDGLRYEVEVNANAIEFDGIEYLLCTIRDISERSKALEALKESELKFRTVVDQSSDIILVCNLDGNIEDLNKAACESLKYEYNELLNTNIHNIYLSNQGIKTKHDFADESEAVIVMTQELRRKDGSSFIGDIRTRMIEIGGIKHVLVVIRDITEQKLNEEKIKYLSFHDSLTGLYNRTFFEEEVKRLDTNRQLPISFIMGDVNGLKLTNDVFGHEEGDHLLKAIAYIIKNSCRSEDIIARWGGDEFMVMLPCTSEKRAEEICREIREKCSESRKITGNDVIEPSISLGYATKLTSDEKIEHIIKKAEDFMYRKKLLESRSMHSSLVASMRSTLYEKSFENEEHAKRINNVCKKIGAALDLSEDTMFQLDLFSMLHDIGKVAVDVQILNKKGKLTEDEWDIVKRHSETGYRIAKSVPELGCIAELILCHHERWDGKGYPQGIKDDQIPLLSRILSVADAYDAMTEDRPYRKALSKENAIEELISNSGKQFDPEIVRVFLSKVISEL